MKRHETPLGAPPRRYQASTFNHAIDVALLARRNGYEDCVHIRCRWSTRPSIYAVAETMPGAVLAETPVLFTLLTLDPEDLDELAALDGAQRQAWITHALGDAAEIDKKDCTP